MGRQIASGPQVEIRSLGSLECPQVRRSQAGIGHLDKLAYRQKQGPDGNRP